MMKSTLTYWKESDGRYVGSLNAHPDHRTHGDHFSDLKEHRRELNELLAQKIVKSVSQDSP